VTRRDGNRRRSDARDGRRPPAAPARRPSLGAGSHHCRRDGRRAAADRRRLRLVSDDRLHPLLVHELGRVRRVRQHPLDRDAQLRADRDDLPPFWPAFKHNVYWLLFLAFVATPFGLLLAYQLDKRIRGTRIYQSIFFLPVVLSLAIIGFIWGFLIYSGDQGLINNLTGHTGNNVTDWIGDPHLNLWAVLVAVGWRHAATS